jgi:Domain of unknown function (DUF4365)
LARRPIKLPRKKRTREHVLADLSANHVEKVALSCGFALDRVWHDYGLDLALYTFDGDGYLESGVVWIQVKASDKPRKTRDGSSLLVRLQRRDILAWLADAYPVMLVLYDAQTDRAYWLSIQRHFAGAQAFAKLSSKTITVPIPTANLLSERVMRDFARQKAVVLAPRREPQ